jgi:hypothetical protein
MNESAELTHSDRRIERRKRENESENKGEEGEGKEELE